MLSYCVISTIPKYDVFLPNYYFVLSYCVIHYTEILICVVLLCYLHYTQLLFCVILLCYLHYTQLLFCVILLCYLHHNRRFNDM